MSLLLAMCSFTTSLADSGYVFKGKIGKYPIVLTIWATAAFADGEYYYVSESGKTKCARFEKRNVQKSGKTKRSKKIAHTTL